MSQNPSASTNQNMVDMKSFIYGVYYGRMVEATKLMPVETDDKSEQPQNSTTVKSDEPETYAIFSDITSATDLDKKLEVAQSAEGIMNRVKDVLIVGEGEMLESGEASELAEELAEVVRLYGSSAISLIANNIFDGTVGPTVASEVLCILGDLDDGETHGDRLLLLKKGLSNKSSRIRVGAVLGLSRLEDPRSIDHLEAAHKSEPYEFLQRYISQAIQVLREHNCGDI